MDLSDQAQRALEALQRKGSELRFEVAEVCHSSRWRLSVHYRDGRPGAGELRLGLAYSPDRAGLEELRRRLAEAEGRRAAVPTR